MNVRTDLAMAYHMGYDDALAKRMPDATKAGVLNSYICTNSERTSGTCHNIKASWPSLFECDECGYSNDDTYYGSEWHFKFCPNCGAKVVEPTTNDVDAEVSDD